MDLFSSSALFALGQVLMINVVLSGDNAVVIGMVAARVELKDPRTRHHVGHGRRRCVACASGYGGGRSAEHRRPDAGRRDHPALGGVAALSRHPRAECREAKPSKPSPRSHRTTPGAGHRPHAKLPLSTGHHAIAIADISMSVDNVLAIAGAANNNIPVLVIGLVVSIALMGVAATYIAKLLQRYHWLSYVGVVLICRSRAKMIWDGSGDVPEIMRFFHESNRLWRSRKALPGCRRGCGCAWPRPAPTRRADRRAPRRRACRPASVGCGQSLPHTSRSGAALTKACAIGVASGYAAGRLLLFEIGARKLDPGAARVDQPADDAVRRMLDAGWSRRNAPR